MSSDHDPHERFNDLVGDLDYPMFIATARSEAGERARCLVGFATQCSIAPSRSQLVRRAVLDRLDLGDHVGFLRDPVEVELQVPQTDLTFHRARRIDPGHEP